MLTDPPHLSAIVLAGGLSSRMGQDKALIQVEGVPLLWRTCQIALHCTNHVYVVTPWVERYRVLVSPQVQFIAETPAPGELNSQTPLKGFLQGFAHMQTDWVLLLACDLPHLRIEILQNWIEALNAAEATIALPQNPEGWWEPLCGFYHRRCLPDLQHFIDSGGRSFLRWLEQQPVQALPLSDPAMIFNCNTPADLENLQDSSR
ncbi:molybdenum cofactor guanylyltransferase [Phormidium tenue FACHB-886]|nr:molybdenum cofactor guanylyltransferase [Phormidium tenue FACHB-886]